MSIENIVYVSIGFITGIFVYFTITNIRTLVSSVYALKQNNHTPEEMAKKILTMKMPISELPPELAEQIKQEAMEMKKGESYIG